MSAVLDKPAEGRPFYKRWTVIGGSLYSVVQYLESQDLVPTGTGAHLVGLAEHGGALLAVLGVYRKL